MFILNNLINMEQVNHPAHYQNNGKECIDLMQEKYGLRATIDFCILNAFKYIFRCGKKEGNPDYQELNKAEWYLNWADKHNVFSDIDTMANILELHNKINNLRKDIEGGVTSSHQ